MNDERSEIQEIFSKSPSGLVAQYDLISSMPSSMRIEYVQYANDFENETERLISSDKTNSAIILLLHYQYFSRFKYKIHGGDNWHGPNGRAMSHIVDGFKHVCTMAKASNELFDKFKSFIYHPHSLEEFLSVSLQGLSNADFSTKFRFVTDNLFGIQLPNNETQDISSWVVFARLTDENWDYEYKDKIKELNARWFKLKSSLIEVEDEWRERKAEIANFIGSISSIFPELYASERWLKYVNTRDFQYFIKVDDINTSYQAIIEGVKLKHLLLEENHKKAQDLMKILGGPK